MKKIIGLLLICFTFLVTGCSEKENVIEFEEGATAEVLGLDFIVTEIGSNTSTYQMYICIDVTNNTDSKIYLNAVTGDCIAIADGTVLGRLSSWTKSYVEPGETIGLYYSYRFSSGEVNVEDYKFVMYFNKDAQLTTYLKAISA